ncbi:ATP-dependent nuclease [Psychrobacter immobilis]|uniref:ATP-dependent nuclease n=1 Tax=Psychrobacter immobilis TaxID=498 RepID=UPI003FD100B3
MYISKIKIDNFRNFKENEIEFNDGINVIIGHNNAGKSNLIKALGLVLNPNSKKRLSIHDFNMNASLDELRKHSPKVSITVTISKGNTSNNDDLVTVSEWLTSLTEDYEAKLTYEFFLPERYENAYFDRMNDILGSYRSGFCAPYTMKYILLSKPLVGPISRMKNEAFKTISNEFLRFYTYKIWGGEVANQNQADSESLQKFDFQFLDAIRDVERDLISGRNVMLKEVLHFFLDYEIKSSQDTDEQKNDNLKNKREDFYNKASGLIEVLDKRIASGRDKILSYASDTGASLKSKPGFEGETSDIEMLSFLRLIIEEKTGFKIPASHNGLGYNNLIYISILLAKMQANADEEYFGGNSKVFPMLVIEEPEAHLHPSMQDKFLKFLKTNISNDTVRQIFITSHSTHVTSATELEEIICLHNDIEGNSNVGYLAKVFDNSADDLKSLKYVKRFLDATKSNMLFAEKIILVEGLAEQLLMGIFAESLGNPLENHHVSVINIGGRYFNHFLKLFDTEQSTSAIFKKVVCITDRDPTRREKIEDEEQNQNSYEKCYPFEYGLDSDKYEYKDHPSHLIEKYKDHKNIRFFSQEDRRGKTFEYDLALHNPNCELLLTESMSNKSEIQKMMELNADNTSADCLALLGNRKVLSKENERIKQAIEALNDSWADEEKKYAVIASRYLNSIGKGENALELAYALEENLTDNIENFVVPNYIREALKWICE